MTEIQVRKLNPKFEEILKEKALREFTNEEQQIFMTNFIMYVQFDQNEHVVPFDVVWQYLGFTLKGNAKQLLIKNFVENEDYIFASVIAQANISEGDEYTNDNLTSNHRGGQNKEYIYLTPNAFKEFCMYAGTSKAKTIKKYYVKLENMMIETLQEQIQYEYQMSAMKARENTLLEDYDNKNVLYIALIEDDLAKAGYTDNIKRRAKEHKSDYGRFDLLYVVEIEVGSGDNSHIEEKVLNHPDIKNRIVRKHNGRTRRELIRLDQYIGAEQIYDIMLNMKETFCVDKSHIKMQHDEKMMQLQIELLREQTRQLEIKCNFELQGKKLDNLSESNKTIDEILNTKYKEPETPIKPYITIGSHGKRILHM